MESALSIWEQRRGGALIEGIDPAKLEQRVAEHRSKFEKSVGWVSLGADSNRDVAAQFIAAVTATRPLHVFLDPAPRQPAAGNELRVMVATGGTTGDPRHAVHTWDTLNVAAGGLQRWLGGGPISSVCLLPMRHMSGLMQLVRAFVSGGTIAFADESNGIGLPDVGDRFVTSLVPTHLARMLRDPVQVAWLRRLQVVFIGGGPVWPDLVRRARKAGIAVAPCYGMTETAAQIATVPPGDDDGAWAEILPHAQVRIIDENGGPATVGNSGRIGISSGALFKGYWPEIDRRSNWHDSGDLGMLDEKGRLRVLGRADDVIITGGEKVDPAEVEAVVRAIEADADVAVCGLRDEEWGEAVVAVVAGPETLVERLRTELRERLDSYKLPKRWVAVEVLPRNELGKVDRRRLVELAARQLGP